jgi:hypothetical protein
MATEIKLWQVENGKLVQSEVSMVDAMIKLESIFRKYIKDLE